jgi:hypothetical protein
VLKKNGSAATGVPDTSPTESAVADAHGDVRFHQNLRSLVDLATAQAKQHYLKSLWALAQ